MPQHFSFLGYKQRKLTAGLIQARGHKIGTYKTDKISCFDDKRFISDNGIHTLAYFHKDCDYRKRL